MSDIIQTDFILFKRLIAAKTQGMHEPFKGSKIPYLKEIGCEQSLSRFMWNGLKR
jgi:hypothetical protein